MQIKHDSFDEQDAQEILKRAMAHQSQDNFVSEPSHTVSASELDTMAVELGITREHLLAAQDAWAREQTQKADKRQRWSKQRRLLRIHTLAFLGLNGVTVPFLYETDWYGYHTEALLFPFVWTLVLIGHAAIAWHRKPVFETRLGTANRTPLNAAD